MERLARDERATVERAKAPPMAGPLRERGLLLCANPSAGIERRQRLLEPSDRTLAASLTCYLPSDLRAFLLLRVRPLCVRLS